jgi:hypothetical protein
METDISILRKSGHFYFALTHNARIQISSRVVDDPEVIQV